MNSHSCEFNLSDLLRCLSWPLVPVAIFAAAMHGGAHWNLLPAPRPTLDTDRTILIHQAEASRTHRDAEVLLLGDSSCLMDVSAKQLSERLGRRVLSLATLSYLDAGAQSLLLREYLARNRGSLKAVVLLMHPEALRRVGSERHHVSVLTNFLAATDYTYGEADGSRFFRWTGVEIFRGRVLARLTPTPLGGAFGRQHGFSRDLENFMTANLGSVFEPDSVPLGGSAEYRLSPSLEKGARQFRSQVPADVKLLAGLTPVPERFAGADFPRIQAELLRQWGGWLNAEALLDRLPPTQPDELFARTTHLRPSAVPAYTEAMVTEIERLLP